MFIMNLSFNHFAIIKSNHYRYCIRYDIPRILTHAMWANVCVCLIISIWSYIPAHSLFYNDFVIGGGGVVRAHARHQNSMLSVLFSFFFCDSFGCWICSNSKSSMAIDAPCFQCICCWFQFHYPECFFFSLYRMRHQEFFSLFRSVFICV